MLLGWLIFKNIFVFLNKKCLKNKFNKKNYKPLVLAVDRTNNISKSLISTNKFESHFTTGLATAGPPPYLQYKF